MERDVAQGKIDHLQSTVESLTSSLKKRDREVKELESKQRLNAEELEVLRKIVDEFDAAHEDELEASAEADEKA